MKKPKFQPGHRPQTAQDIMRKLLKGGGGSRKRKSLQAPGGNFLQSFTRGGARIGNNFTFAEMQKVDADLSRYGIYPGKTAGTLPERVTAKWLIDHNYNYGGEGYNYNGGDWGFQIPVFGGRDTSGGGGVADFYISPEILSPGGGIILPQGAYWHKQLANAARDDALYLRYQAAGYKLLVMWDYQALNPGELDYVMANFLGGGYK